MAHLQLSTGNIRTYVADYFADEEGLNINENVLQIFNKFNSSHEVAWTRPTITTYPAGNTTGIKVYIGYYAPSNHTLSSKTYNQLQGALFNNIQLPIELTVVRLTGPYADANILSYYLSSELKTKTFYRLINRVLGAIGLISSFTPIATSFLSNILTRTMDKVNLNKTGGQLPTGIVGVKVGINGRLDREASRPRFTEQSRSIGTLTTNNQQVLDISSSTMKNKKNEYSVSVTMAYRV